MQGAHISTFVNKVKWKIRYNLFVKRDLLRRKALVNSAIGSRVFPLTVLSGPFAGMKYISRATGSAHMPKLLGSYESWIHPWLRDLVSRPLAAIHVVGCAEGYYACGIKRLAPSQTVIAYDINPVARELCAELAKENALDIRIADEFSPASVDLAGAAVFMDVEGAESYLLGKTFKDRYRSTVIILETHDHIFGFGDVTTDIIRSFEGSHKIELLTHRDRGDPDSNVSALLNATSAEVLTMTDELRAGRNNWLRMVPRSAS